VDEYHELRGCNTVYKELSLPPLNAPQQQANKYGETFAMGPLVIHGGHGRWDGDHGGVCVGRDGKLWSVDVDV
jgi:hypothetical protein